MADSMVTDYSAATSVNAADWLYLIQSATDKKLSIATLLATLPNTLTKLSGVFVVGGTPQTITNSGTITATQTLTILSNDGGSGTLGINSGTYDGQIKILLFTAGSIASVLSADISVTSISFTDPGHSALLIWYNNAWWPIGGTATITV